MIVGRRISVIDIGSNSVRLLVADVNEKEIIELYKGINTTRLYEDISTDYALDIESMSRTIDAISDYVNIANEKSSDEIYMFATAAVRVAKNKNDFIKKVRQRTKIIPEIILEEKEAEMAFAGVGCNGLCGVIDIGGASTEIAIGDSSRIISVSSAKIGAVKCKEILGSDDSTNDIVFLVESILLPESKSTIEQANSSDKLTWYGVGGTITTMAAMSNNMQEYDSDIINSIQITKEDVDSMINRLQKLSIEDRKNVVGLQPKRADIIIYGLCILKTVMKNCGSRIIIASDNDNLSGYIRLLIKET